MTSLDHSNQAHIRQPHQQTPNTPYGLPPTTAPEQEQVLYQPFLTSCQGLGAKFQPVDDSKGCRVTKWSLSQTPSLTIPEVLDIIRNGGAYCLIWPKDKPQRVVVFDLDDAKAMQAFESWDLPETVKVATRKGVHHYYLVPKGIVLPNIICEGAMQKAGYGKMGVFTRAKVIVGPGSTIDGKQYVLDDAEYAPEFDTLPMEMAMSLIQLKPPTYADEADLAPACPSSDDIKHDILAINEAAHEQNKPLITGNDDFLRFAFATKWGLGAEMALTLCMRWGGKVDDVPKRIWSIIPRSNQMGNFIALAKEKDVKIPKLKTTPTPSNSADKDKAEAEAIVKAFKDQNIPLCPDNQTFCEVGYPLVAIFGVDEANTILATESGYDEKTPGSLKSMEETGCVNPIARLTAYAKKRKVKLSSSGAQEQQGNGIDKGRVVELVADEFGEDSDTSDNVIIQQLGAPGDVVCVAGRPGSGKSEHVLWWASELAKKEMTTVWINVDMRRRYAQERYKKAGLTNAHLIQFNWAEKGSPRKFSTDQLIKAIETEAAGRKIGMIVFDNMNKITRRMWDAIAPKDARGKVEKFNSNDDDHAEWVHDHVLSPVAERFKANSVFIGHPGKNIASKDKYPGSEQWAAGSAICYQIYKPNNTNLAEIPKSVLNLYRSRADTKKSPQKFSLAIVFKSRYCDPRDEQNYTDSYFFTIDKAGQRTTHKISRDICLETDSDKVSKLTGEEVEQITEAVTEYARSKPNKEIGSTELTRKCNLPKRVRDNRHLLSGVIVNTIRYQDPIRGPEGIYWSLDRGKYVVVFYHKQ